MALLPAARPFERGASAPILARRLGAGLWHSAYQPLARCDPAPAYP